MDDKNIHYFSLDNGLKCVLYKKNEIPIVNITLAYKVGSKDEPFDKKGIAHLFEHLMFEGSKNLSKGEFDKICSSIGGTNNAYTSFDITSYYMTIPSSKLEIGLSLEAERLFNFFISQEALDNQKNVVIEEINQTVYDQPYGLYRDKLAELAYSEKCPYSWEIHGSTETVSTVTLDDVYDFRSKYYNPNNAILVISGDINFREVKKLIDKYFGHKSFKIKFSRNKVFKKDFNFKAYSHFRDDVPFEATFVAYHCNGFKKEYLQVADLISIILGTGKSSRLYHSLVKDLNIASQAGCYIDKKAYDSLIIFYAFANERKINAETLAMKIYEEINNFISKIPSEMEILKARNLVKSNFSEEFSNLVGISDNLATFTLFNDNPFELFDMNNKIQKFNSDEILFSSKKIFKYIEGIRVDAKLS